MYVLLLCPKILGMGIIPDWHPIYYEWDEIVPPFYIPNTDAARKDIQAQYITMSRLDQGVCLLDFNILQ